MRACVCRVCLQLLRIGPNITGNRLEEDGDFWPLRMELGRVSFFSRTLLPEEWHLAAMSPPLPIEKQALPFTQVTLPPLSLPNGGTFTWAVYPPSWFGSAVTLYVGANVANAFSGGTEVKTEVANVYTTVRKLVWNKAAMGAAGAASPIQSLLLRMPLSSGCVNYYSWTAGDVAHYRSVAEPDFQICVSTLAFLQSQVVVNLDLSAAPSPGRYPYIQMSTSPPTGLAKFRYATSDNINFYSSTDRAMGTPSQIIPTHSTGFSVLINVMHAREQCDEFIFYMEHLRFRMHCSGKLHLEFYPIGCQAETMARSRGLDCSVGVRTLTGCHGVSIFSFSCVYVLRFHRRCIQWLRGDQRPLHASQTVPLVRRFVRSGVSDDGAVPLRRRLRARGRHLPHQAPAGASGADLPQAGHGLGVDQ